jgi:hypothetical protein
MEKFIDQDENVDESAENQIEFETVGNTAIEYISAAYYALDACEHANLMTKDGQMRLARIKRKCLKIIDHCITEMYDELFDNDDSE